MREWVELLDEARADELASGRARERWLRQQAAESATLVGTLLDLAEAGAGVSVATVGGRRHDGRIAALGADVVALQDRDAVTVVRLGAVTVVRPHPGERVGVASGDRPAALDRTFAEVLAHLAADGPEVAVTLVTGDVLAGALLAMGDDVVTLRLAPGADGLAYCSGASVASVRFRSG